MSTSDNEGVAPYAHLAAMPVSERHAWASAEMDRLRVWVEQEHRRVLLTRKAVQARYGKTDVEHVLAARHVEVSHQHAFRMLRVMHLTYAAGAGASAFSEESRQRYEEEWQHHAREYARGGRFHGYPADALWTDEQRQMAYFRADQRSVGEARAFPTG